jgi:sigma-B regulation protein RsbU (phosphoserine phosphatase)
MDRGASALFVSLFVVLVGGLLIASGFDLPGQAYLGLTLRGTQAAMVVPGGPADRAGIAPGDFLRREPPPDGIAARVSPIAGARPGQALDLAVIRQGVTRPVTLVPEPLPAVERRLRSALLAVACGFVMLGGWVWSERRDGLTWPFQLLTLLFGVMFAPQPAFGEPIATLALDLVQLAGTLALPAACIHFCARFPEPATPRPGAPAFVPAAYGIALLMFVPWIGALALGPWGPARPITELLELLGTLWFVAGVLTAGVLFVRSYVRAESADARRRLRVAVAGAVFGLAPLLAVIVSRTVAPAHAMPGERAALFLVLLVPASFAYAIAVHRVFEFRVALRSVRGPLIAFGLIAVAYGVGESLGPFRMLGAADGVTRASLAAMGLLAVAAGPVRPLVRGLALRVAGAHPASLAEMLSRALPADASDAATLDQACAALREHLRLDRCVALVRQGTRWMTTDGHPAPGAPGPALAIALARTAEPLAIAESDLPPADRDALDALGAGWVLGVGAREPVAALLLGHRLGGSWLDRSESDALARFAHELALTLENAGLRRAARTHGALDRALEEAGAIQSHLLPRRAPVYPTLDCAAATLSAEAVGGDYYDFVAHGGRRFTLAVGDAIGHGVPAALLLAGVQARFRSAARGGTPAQVLSALNRELSGLAQPERFIGLLCARVDARLGRLQVANAGLTPPLVLRRDHSREVIAESGLVLGVSHEARYADVLVQLRAGDVAVLHTDGLTEARCGDEMFGLERVWDVLEANAHRRARDVLEALLAAVKAFAEPPLDDLTILVLKQLAAPAAAPEAAWRSPVWAPEAEPMPSGPALKVRLLPADPQG